MRQLILENPRIDRGLITLSAKDYKYLRQVLRVKTGDMLNVRINGEELKQCTVASIDDKARKILLQICADTINHKSVTRGVQADETNDARNLNYHEYYLFQFIPKATKFEQIVRQATECGISIIVPVIGEYTEKSSLFALQGNKKERLEKIIREARQQSGSPVQTKVLEPLSLAEALIFWKNQNGDLGLVLSERNEKSENLKDILSYNKNKKIAIAVGSEGGISPSEIDLLLEKGLFHAVHFAVNILRCETAALYGIAAVQSALE